MALKQQINDDIKAAMKAKDKLALEVLRAVKNEFMKVETSGKGDEVDDDKAIAVMKNLIKQRKEAAGMYIENGRQELADKENAEIKILENYLPAAIAEDVIRGVVDDVVAKTGASSPADMGKVMGPVMGQLKAMDGLADGALVQQLVKAALGA